MDRLRFHPHQILRIGRPVTNVEDSLLNKIQNLLTLAGREDTPEHERRLAQERAEVMMAKYRIDMAMLAFNDIGKQREIVSHELERHRLDYGGYLNSMMVNVYRHFGCPAHQKWDKITAVGYEDDLRMASIMWSGVHMDFVSKMMPVWSDSRTFDHNVYLLKESGKSWMEIVNAAPEGARLTRNSGSTLRNSYQRWAKASGVDANPHPRNPKAWRAAFVASYEQTLTLRLVELDRMRASTEKDANDDDSNVSLAIQTDAERVMAEFYTMFPDLHPDARNKTYMEMLDREEKRRNAMSDKERAAEDRRMKRYLNKKQPAPRYHDGAGWAAGRKAAREIDLGGNKTTTGRAGEIG